MENNENQSPVNQYIVVLSNRSSPDVPFRGAEQLPIIIIFFVNSNAFQPQKYNYPFVLG